MTSENIMVEVVKTAITACYYILCGFLLLKPNKKTFYSVLLLFISLFIILLFYLDGIFIYIADKGILLTPYAGLLGQIIGSTLYFVALCAFPSIFIYIGVLLKSLCIKVLYKKNKKNKFKQY